VSTLTEQRREQLFNSLGELYSKLDEELSGFASSGNPCGRCRECCTGGGLNLHNVTVLELEYISEREGPQKIPSFRSFVAREGEVDLCPYFDETQWGCGIYSSRPFSCRLFGHHRSQDTTLPEVCVFKGQEQIFQTERYYRDVPRASELRDLVRAFWPFQSRSHRHAESGTLPVALNPGSARPVGDALDQALQLQSEERLPEALQALAESDLEQTSYSLYCVSLILEGLGCHEDAARALKEALLDAPDCVPLHFRLACNLLYSGQGEEGEEEFRKTLELEPEHVQALALLGGHLFTQGQNEDALQYLLRASRLEPDNLSIQRMLQVVKQS
jgi:Fe-S-cluster containining protein